MKEIYTNNSGSFSQKKRAETAGESHMSGELTRLLLLAITVCGVWLTIEDRWGSNFQFPTRYMADSHYILGMMKLAKEGDLGIFTHITTQSLGTPFIGQLNDFPQTERVIVWLGGQIARVIGLMPAANAILMISAVVAACSFYIAARLWRVSRLASWTFAIVYTFLPQSQRSLDHLGIGFTGLLPLQFYCCWYIATVLKLSWCSFRFRLTFLVSLLSGLLNVYWIFFFIQFYTIALLCRIIKRREGFIVSLIPLIATCLVAGSFLVSFIIYREIHGLNSAALVRTYLDMERWALKPIDLILPNWGPNLNILSDFFKSYYGGRLPIGELWWGGYIGFCSLLGLAFLFFKGAQRQLNKRSPSLPLLAVLWIIIYTSVGGTHAIISLMLNFYDIRGTNRYSTAIATIGLLYFIFFIQRVLRSWPFKVSFFILSALALLAIVDQSFKTSTFYLRHDFSIKDRVIADRDLASKLEDRLEERAMLYILPAFSFPEPFGDRAPYELFSLYDPIRPFLYSSKLRYSYGSHKGRQGTDWQLDVQNLPAGEMAAILESYGFSGILLNRMVYEDRGERLLAAFSEAGWPMEFEQGIGNEWVFIRLTPSPNPIFPTSTPYALSVVSKTTNS